MSSFVSRRPPCVVQTFMAIEASRPRILNEVLDVKLSILLNALVPASAPFPVGAYVVVSTSGTYGGVELAPRNRVAIASGLQGDIWSTARQGLAWSKFEPSDTTAVWSAGPIGLLTAYSARLRGASKDVIVDRVQQRLQRAQSFGAIPINFEAQNITAIIQSQVPWGIMRQVECVGLEAFDPGLTYNPSYIWNQRLGIAHYGDGVGFLALWGHTSVITPLAPRADLIPTNVSLPYTQSWLERVSLSGGVVVPSQTAGHLIKIIGSGVARSIGDPSMTVDIGIEKVPEYYARFGRLEITIYINVLQKTMY